MSSTDGKAALDALRWESVRRLTFRGGWPHGDAQGFTNAEMACFGFYYTGIGDNAKCAFCWLEIKQWNTGLRGLEGTVATCHKRASPTCPFVLGQDVKNIPLNPVTGQDILDYGKAFEITRLNLKLAGQLPLGMSDGTSAPAAVAAAFPPADPPGMT